MFNSVSDALYFFHSKKWHRLKILELNLTRCKFPKSDVLGNFNSKSDKLYNLNSETFY